ncbi:HAD family phosphatase [Candidatus Binatia bacterium]|nr:HAD family phosphatase [Candidatus Binatia bacterium]
MIFDVDGVLVDSYDAHFRSWRDVLRERGLDMTEADFADTFGRTSREIIRRFWGDAVDDATARAIDDRKEALYRDIVREAFPAMEGAITLLDQLHAAGFALAVGSSAPPENVLLTLDGLGRRELFAAVVTGRDVTRGKPDPQVFLLGAERLGVAPERCAVIEDAPAGVRAAAAAGMASVALLGTAPRETLVEAGAWATVASLRELSPATLAELIDRPR